MKSSAHARWSFIVSMSLVAGSLSLNAYAADKIEVLDSYAVVSCFSESAPGSPSPCLDDGAQPSNLHKHKDLEKWKLKVGDSFEINRKLFEDDARFFDRPWNWFNEMQKPKLLVINPGKNPFSIAEGGGARLLNSFDSRGNFLSFPADELSTDELYIDDFLFVFGIHNLQNEDGSRTPHALFYWPIRAWEKTGENRSDVFFLLIFHIPDDDRHCDEEQHFDLARKFCKRMRQLSVKWNSGFYTDAGLANEASTEIRDLLGLGPPHLAAIKTLSATRPVDPDFEKVVEKIKAIVFGQKMHNGVIHGTVRN